MGVKREKLTEALDWYYLCKEQLQSAARESGIPRNTLKNRVRIALELGIPPSGDDPRSGFLSKKQRKLTKDHGIPASQLKHGWVKGDDGSHFYKVSRPEDDPQAMADAMIDGLSNVPLAIDTPRPEACLDDVMAVIPIFDAHIGMLARNGSAESDWNRGEALERVADGVGRMVSAAPACAVGLIIFGGDTAHTDNNEAVTPRGRNPLDADGSYFEIISSTISAIKIAIDIAITKFGRVIIRVLRGNHDEHAYVALTLAVSEHYRNIARVSVQTTENDYLLHEFGSNMLVAHHGDKAKPESLVMFAADQYSEAWGRTKHRLILSGHIHHEKRKDIGGATVESMRSMAVRDEYAYSHGYVGRSTTYLIVLHRTDGEILRIKMNY